MSRSSRLSLPLLLCIGMALYATPSRATDQADETRYHLQYKLQRGESLRWWVTHRAAIRTTIQGKTQTAHTLSESVNRWDVNEVTADGEMQFLQSVESVKMTNRLPDREEIGYDSQEDATPPAGFEDVARAIGVPLAEILIDPSGQVVRRDQRHETPGGVTEISIVMPLPAEPVAIGHVWQEPHEVRVVTHDGRPLKIETERRFELLSVADEIATISVDFQVITPLRDPTVEIQLLQRFNRGTVKFDLNAGRIVGQQTEIDKRILGGHGQDSATHYRAEYREKLLKPNERVARRPPPVQGPSPPSAAQ